MQNLDVATKFIISLASMVGTERVGVVATVVLIVFVVATVLLIKKLHSVFVSLTIVAVISVLSGAPVVSHFNSLPADKVMQVGQEAFERGLVNNLQEIVDNVKANK